MNIGNLSFYSDIQLDDTEYEVGMAHSYIEIVSFGDHATAWHTGVDREGNTNQ
jgi:hypothetical protein